VRYSPGVNMARGCKRNRYVVIDQVESNRIESVIEFPQQLAADRAQCRRMRPSYLRGFGMSLRDDGHHWHSQMSALHLFFSSSPSPIGIELPSSILLRADEVIE
jgi:hypothetical protein